MRNGLQSKCPLVSGEPARFKIPRLEWSCSRRGKTNRRRVTVTYNWFVIQFLYSDSFIFRAGWEMIFIRVWRKSKKVTRPAWPLEYLTGLDTPQICCAIHRPREEILTVYWYCYGRNLRFESVSPLSASHTQIVLSLVGPGYKTCTARRAKSREKKQLCISCKYFW